MAGSVFYPSGKCENNRIRAIRINKTQSVAVNLLRFFYTKKRGDYVNNINNLIPNSQRSPQELKAMTSKGGIASGKARREKKMFQEAVLNALKAKDTDGMTMLEKGVVAVIERMLKGDTKAFEVLRDTAGEKPTEKVEASVTNENKELLKEYMDGLKDKK